MRKIDIDLINGLSNDAKISSRRRMNLNIHKNPDDPIQRFLNAMEPGTYIRPHKHEFPLKRELFALVRGEFLVIEFDDEGNISDHIILSHESGNFAVEIDQSIWHTVIALKASSVALEVKDEPYNPEDDKIFAEWAPLEADTMASKKFIDKILQKLNIIFPNLY